MQKACSHTIDLHSHTLYSDGSLTVDDLISHVVNHGVETLAITDHDSVGAHLEIKERALELPCNIIPGVEISCQFGNREIHIVGLQIDPANKVLTEFLQQQQSYRRQRLLEFAAKLEKAGVSGVGEKVETINAEAVTRTHLSQLLVEMGVAPDANRVFKRWIGRKGRAYVPARWPTLEKVVEVIGKAGGIAVVAHPGRYQLSRKQLKQLLEQFHLAGGRAVELAYPNADLTLIRWLAERSSQLGLLASQGADFHNPDWRWVKPGHFPTLPSTVQPVWEMW